LIRSIRIRRRSAAALAGALALAGERGAGAGETTLAEPIIEENVTDIDAVDVGSFELDLNAAALRSADTRTGLWRSSLEFEWRALDRLGIGGELATGAASDGWSPASPSVLSPRGTVSYVAARDFDRQMFLQLEANARRSFGDAPAQTDPTEIALPYSAGIRGAAGLGPVVMRFGALAAAGGSYAHAPVHGSYAAILTLPSPEAMRFYVGGELLADWARRAPFVAIPELLLLTRVFEKPIRFGLGLPATLGARDEERALGLAFRLVLEPEE